MAIAHPFSFFKGPFVVPTSPQVFTWVSNGDTNGVCYFRGRNNGVATWTNPHTALRVTVARSSTLNGSDDELVNRTAEYNTTNNSTGEWVSLDLGNATTLVVTSYSLRNGNGAGGGSGWALLNWKLQGSNNNSTWTDLETRTGDTTMGTINGDWAHYILGGTPSAYRYLRILGNGLDTLGLQFMQLCEFEFYGTFTF